MGISDMITEFINQALKDSDGVLELQRGEIAEQFGCVPSQINYVISTRFSPEHGYIVESRRGGGGYIRIRRVPASRQLHLMHAINSIGNQIDAASVAAILDNLAGAGILSERDVLLISAALSSRSLEEIPPEIKGSVRATILKRMLIVCTVNLN